MSDTGNGLTVSGGVWHHVTVSGAAARPIPASPPAAAEAGTDADAPGG
jgi:hypothetical protein